MAACPEELVERCWNVIEDVNGFLEGQPTLPPIRVIAYVEGGVVQGARSNLPAEQIDFAVCDHEDESTDDEYIGCTEDEYDSLEFGIF